MNKLLPMGVVVLLFAALAGWVMNIVTLVGMIGGEITAMFVARCVGCLFAPLGAVLGYC